VKVLRIRIRDDDPIRSELRDVFGQFRQHVPVVPKHDPLPHMRAKLLEHHLTPSNSRTTPIHPVFVPVSVLEVVLVLVLVLDPVKTYRCSVSTRRSAACNPAT